MDEQNNGNDPQTSMDDYNTLKRYDAAIRMENRQYNSVLQQSMHSAFNEPLYHELITANWESLDEADLWCNAYDEAKRYGADTEWLRRRLVSHKAGVHSGRQRGVWETISHTTFTTNTMNGDRKGIWGWFKSKDRGQVQSKNPLT